MQLYISSPYLAPSVLYDLYSLWPMFKTCTLTVCCCTTTQVRFVIMGNLFCSHNSIHRRFDLKGSSLGRTTDKPQTEIDQYTTLKDLDLNFIFRLKKQWFQDFQRCNHFLFIFQFVFQFITSTNLCIQSIMLIKNLIVSKQASGQGL